MVKFDPDRMDQAMNITEQADADEYFKQYVKWTLKCWSADEDHPGKDVAVYYCKMNLTYKAGYYNNETRSRVEKLFKCMHPYFGPIDEIGPPGPNKAFDIGLGMGSGKYSEL